MEAGWGGEWKSDWRGFKGKKRVINKVEVSMDNSEKFCCKC